MLTTGMKNRISAARLTSERQAGEAQAVEERAAERGAAGPAGSPGKSAALHDLGGVVEEIAGDEGRDGGQEVGERDEQPGAGEEEGEAVEERVVDGRAGGPRDRRSSRRGRAGEPDAASAARRDASRRERLPQARAAGAGDSTCAPRPAIERRPGSASLDPLAGIKGGRRNPAACRSSLCSSERRASEGERSPERARA